MERSGHGTRLQDVAAETLDLRLGDLALARVSVVERIICTDIGPQ